MRPPWEWPQGGISHVCYFRKGLRPEWDQVNTAEMHFEPKMDSRSLPASDSYRPASEGWSSHRDVSPVQVAEG